MKDNNPGSDCSSVGVAWLGFKAVWPTTGRDFCALLFTYELPNGDTIVVATSVSHPQCPPLKSYGI